MSQCCPQVLSIWKDRRVLQASVLKPALDDLARQKPAEQPAPGPLPGQPPVAVSQNGPPARNGPAAAAEQPMTTQASLVHAGPSTGFKCVTAMMLLLLCAHGRFSFLLCIHGLRDAGNGMLAPTSYSCVTYGLAASG